MDTEAKTNAGTAVHAGTDADPDPDARLDAGAAADAVLLARLRAGEEDAFTELVERYHSRLARLAASFGARGELVQDIAQETWLAALRGLSRFEGRSSLQSWLFQICANRARTMTAREQRVIPLDPEQLGLEQQSGPDSAWPPQDSLDEERARDSAMAARIKRTIADLTGTQGRVVSLRDAQGMSSAQVCEILSISEANQRVLLHRGRARVRAELARS